MVVPQLEATVFAYLGQEGSHRYSHIRLWGSVGFVVTVIILGSVLESQPIDILPWILFGIFVVVSFSTLLVNECDHGYSHAISHEPLWDVLRKPVVLAFFCACLLLQASHGSYYTFYSLYLKAHHYAPKTIGQLWALAVIAEVIAFMVLHQLLLRFSLRHLLMSSFALGTIRWALIAYCVDNIWILLFTQTLHAASFALYHGVAIQFVYRYFTGRLQGRGQALYSSLTFGLGGAIGSLISGYMWDSMGSTWTYMLSSGLCAGAFLIVVLWLKTE
jgi:PPP family 3-phenylpropionic acid transporter